MRLFRNLQRNRGRWNTTPGAKQETTHWTGVENGNAGVEGAIIGEPKAESGTCD